MPVVVIGGAGYIGSHIVQSLMPSEDVVVVDDLSTGDARRIEGTRLERIDITSDAAADALARLMAEVRADAVILLAARKRVDESVARPAWYYRQNVGGTANVLDAMERAGVPALVFSSSAAVYGSPSDGVVSESLTPAPVNPYGETKLACEWLVQDAARAWGLRAVSLRYFNVAGAVSALLADDQALNLIPITLRLLAAGTRPRVYGTDYPTADGSCVRDYVHITDLVDAHVATLRHVVDGARTLTTPALNVGTGVGSSVLEVMAEIAHVTGVEADPELLGRRAGDPASVVADVGLIERTLGWRARFGLESIVASAIAAQRHV